jgi:DNA polymerase III epsilon subunit-like protein
MQVVIYLNKIKKINTNNNKLTTLCDYFNIELDPHDAMNDIEATYELNEKIKELVK